MEPISTNHKVNMLIEEFDKIFIADRDETLKDGDKRGISFAMLPMHKKKIEEAGISVWASSVLEYQSDDCKQ